MEFISLLSAMVALMKSLDMPTTVIMTTLFCALLVLFFNVIALWKLTAPVRQLSGSVDNFTNTFTNKMNEGEKRFDRIEGEIHIINKDVGAIKAHLKL